jgi:hypothetical protein
MNIRFALLWLSVVGVAGAGYLPTIGPAPLRFRDPGVATAKFVLPPLPGAAPAPAVAEVPAAAAGELVVTAGTTVRLSVVDQVTGTNEVMVTPQMLLETYRRSSDAKVLTPLTFVPPTPAAASRATYESR